MLHHDFAGRVVRELSADQRVLDEHLERFREVFEEAAIGMATMTLTGRLVRANRALAALVRSTVSELVGVFYGDLTDGRGEQVAGVLDDNQQHPLDVAILEHGRISALGTKPPSIGTSKLHTSDAAVRRPNAAGAIRPSPSGARL